MENVITFAHNIIKEYITKESLTIDATVGNGYDTVFLAKHAKHVYGFDIQQDALDNTLARCQKEQLDNVTLFLTSHEHIRDYLDQPIDACVFNLGYLPKGNKDITTKATSTITAINDVLPLISVKGVIAITIYIGHEEGKQEQKQLEEFFLSLDSSLYTVVRYQHINRPDAPYTVCIQKR